MVALYSATHFDLIDQISIILKPLLKSLANIR